ncbi:MAG: hypothetical protein HUJ68_13415 [Clostridia bacterium]|nr:hypothetical protein [Clostridia bacterium]
MKKVLSIFVLGILISNVFAQNHEKKFSGWKIAETEHFDFIFEESARETTEAYAKIADEAWNKIGKIYGFPKDKIKVYVTDRTNTVNAFTYFSPLEIGMFTTPLNLIDFGFRTEWKNLFFTHELIHAANINFEDKNYIGQKLFGPIVSSYSMSLTTPGWALEGLTTVLETELTQGGRGRSPFFELMYKAPTLDNSFISYKEIGMEAEPPAGQSYVMGYLIMRSIADRYGISSLADIERNKSFSVDFEKSIYNVTGETAENIYKDVKIALAKKYSDERKIPEGKIISPRENKNYYFKPASILDDGTIITLRSLPGKNSAVVKLNPSKIKGSNYLEDSKPEKNLNTVMSETILFEDYFPDQNSVTADKYGTIYAVTQSVISDRMPGAGIENSISKWTEKEGLKRITKGASFFEPTVSRNGKILCALKQDGLYFNLYKIDTEIGKYEKIISIPECNILQPSLNEDGSKIAFLKVSDFRASVCEALISEPQNYIEIANAEGDITDPIYPSWNSDGKLLFGSNYRGRLEVFEVTENEKNYNINPVVSDPVGALWAYKNDRGIYYFSYASNGYVIKMKPESEWGVVPDFEGPSKPGEIISFRKFENDYPDFNPYPIEQKRTAYSEEKKKSEIKSKNKEPIPLKDIEIKYREKFFCDKAETLSVTSGSLKNERNYLALPSPYFYTPFLYSIESEKTNYPGYGMFMMYLNPKLQNSMGIGLVSGLYYPKLNNFNFLFSDIIMAGPYEIDFYISRKIKFEKEKFIESNSVKVAGLFPILYRYGFRNTKNFSILTKEDLSLNRNSNEIFDIGANIPFDFVSISNISAGYFEKDFLKKTNHISYSINASGLFVTSNSTKRGFEFFTGAQAETSLKLYTGGFNLNFDISGRYLSLPNDFPYTIDSLLFLEENLDNSVSGRFVCSCGISIPTIIPLISLYNSYDKLLSITDEGTFVSDSEHDIFAIELGLSIEQNIYEFKFGIAQIINEKGFNSENFKFTSSFKFGALKF